MSAPSASKRARPAAFDAVVTTLKVPGLGTPEGMFVLADGMRLVSSSEKTILHLPPSGRLSTLAGYPHNEAKRKDGEGIKARFKEPKGLTVDRAGSVVVADSSSHAICKVTKAGAVVSTLAGNGEAGFTDGQGADARFNKPHSVVVAANGDLIVSDRGNHCLRVVTPEGAVRTLVGNGQAGFADGEGADARFNCPGSLAIDPEGNVLVSDFGNHSVRLVTMAGAVSTVAGNGVSGFADGAGAAARFHHPSGIVVDGKGTIVVADKHNNRLRKIVGGQVTTLAGNGQADIVDGSGAVARFRYPVALALDERGRLLVGSEYVFQKDTLRVVEASLVPPLWMGPVEEAVEVPEAAMRGKAQAAIAALLQDYAKMVDNSEPQLADVVLLVEGERFHAHRGVIAARSQYFRSLLLSEMQGGRSEGGVQEIELGEVTAGALRVVLRYLYTAELPESGEGGVGTGGGRGEGGGGGGGDGEEAAAGQVLERAVLKAADLFQVEGLLEHCVEAFGRGFKVDTAVEQLVWAHNHGPVEARTVATEYFLHNFRRIQAEARDTMQLLKQLPSDTMMELMQSM